MRCLLPNEYQRGLQEKIKCKIELTINLSNFSKIGGKLYFLERKGKVELDEKKVAHGEKCGNDLFHFNNNLSEPERAVTTFSFQLPLDSPFYFCSMFLTPN